MDRHFLTYIQRKAPIADALAPYHVALYIASTRARSTGSFHALEPAQAGPSSPRMSVEICQPPAAVFHHFDGYTYIYSFPFSH